MSALAAPGARVIAEEIVASSTLPSMVPLTPTPVILPVATLMGRLGREMAALHVVSETVQDAVSLPGQGISPDARSCAGMQGLDTLTQHLAALAALLADLALVMPEDLSVDLTVAAARLSLGRLCARLTQGEESEAVDAGTVDLF